MTWRIPLFDLDYGPEEEQAVLDVLHDRWLTMGDRTQAFELEFATFVGTKHAVAVTNATAALHVACLSLGIGPGDEVIVPSLTFAATANAVRYTGAQVRFADILGPDELNISPQEIEKQITPQTKAVIVVHYAGYPCNMPAIMDIVQRYSLTLIEDAAHAPGASLNGKQLGAWGDAACFSFYSNKNLSVGEGGMLVTNRDEIAEKARLLRSHAMTSLTWDRHQGSAFTYDVTDLGYNYRIDEIRAALGLVQLQKLKTNNRKRRAITELYWECLHETSLILPFEKCFKSSWKANSNPGRREPPQSLQAYQPAFHIFPIMLPDRLDRNSFINFMHTAGIQTSIHYPPVHKFSYYRRDYSHVVLPQTEHAAERQVTLPLYPNMTETDINIVISTVRNGLKSKSIS